MKESDSETTRRVRSRDPGGGRKDEGGGAASLILSHRLAIHS